MNVEGEKNTKEKEKKNLEEKLKAVKIQLD